MLKTIKISQLKVGMYVVLPQSWFNHSFLKNQFLIESEKQLQKVHQSGFDEIPIDTDKGYDLKEYIDREEEKPAPQKKPEPAKLESEQFKEAIRNEHLPPEIKAKIVYSRSLDIMKNLFESPKAEAIQEVKETAYDIVDLILGDNDTSNCLLQIGAHDYYTYTHSVNVGVLSISLIKKLYKGYNEQVMHDLGAGFFLHDIGKVRVDPAIINKPGKLTIEEMHQMQRHTSKGYKVLAEAGHLNNECKKIVLHHHEREDGSGYPRGLSGYQIHDYGRICSISDVFDALTSNRSYHKSMQLYDALTYMKEKMLHHFHKEIFAEFVRLFMKK